METCVILEYKCGCEKHEWYKIRFYNTRLENTEFDALPEYAGSADLKIKGTEAHISAFVMKGYNRFRRMHDVDLEAQIRMNFPQVKVVYWERHKQSESIKFMRQLNTL